MPDAVRAFQEISSSTELWEGVASPDTRSRLKGHAEDKPVSLEKGDLARLARLFARVIDYRSHFTATHSAGVAAVAETLAGMLGFSPENCDTIKVAGYLHDLGKLTVPTELIEKPGRLNNTEYVHVQDHARQTRKFLEKIPELGHGIEWAAQHHERLNGTGYPEHCAENEIAFGSRVVVVADILTAVTEDRPYRDGMGRDGALDILTRLTEGGYLDPEVFGTAMANFEELNAVRLDAQAEAEEDYRCRFESSL
jgi:putative nucleotidyltransferase with HDIG domain